MKKLVYFVEDNTLKAESLNIQVEPLAKDIFHLWQEMKIVDCLVLGMLPAAGLPTLENMLAERLKCDRQHLEQLNKKVWDDEEFSFNDVARLRHNIDPIRNNLDLFKEVTKQVEKAIISYASKIGHCIV